MRVVDLAGASSPRAACRPGSARARARRAARPAARAVAVGGGVEERDRGLDLVRDASSRCPRPRSSRRPRRRSATGARRAGQRRVEQRGGQQRAVGRRCPTTARAASAPCSACATGTPPSGAVSDAMWSADRVVGLAELVEHLQRGPDVRGLARRAAPVGLQRVAVAAVGGLVGLERGFHRRRVAVGEEEREAPLLQHARRRPDVFLCLVDHPAARYARGGELVLNESDEPLARRDRARERRAPAACGRPGGATRASGAPGRRSPPHQRQPREVVAVSRAASRKRWKRSTRARVFGP